MSVLVGVIFAVLAGLVMLAVCIAAVRALVRAVMAVLRIIAILGLAAAIAASIGLGIWVAGADPQPAVLMGLLAFPFAVRAVWRRPHAQSVPAPPMPVQDDDEELVVAYAGPVESAADAAVGNAWEQLASMVPLEDSAQLFEARAVCVQLLRLSEEAALDLDIIACVVLLRHSLPDLATNNARLWARADPAERTLLARGILEDAERLAVYASRVMTRGARHDRRAYQDGLAALRNHIAARTR